ncbi:dihydropteroate synthase [Acetobacter suratthaniensis]|uniref:Dihydropteroate synthase n=1 Tax=Acetobacter suratthaniensis TaxID=1502841 RepID=A0ABS3LNB8_9PROT|nr:dihydropteroate synthase [Acetobacter suratthaniensis]MBO1328864.1 dihydropteroate synthase [Acetobacter suratthaniensis]MCX2567013.1 dihydropteroate synthase [Acetobacter suratthaniensis]
MGQWHRLVEPMGLLYGDAAVTAVRQGTAQWLMGGDVAFSAVRLIEGAQLSAPRPVSDIPAGWQGELARVVAPVSAAGLPAGAQVMGILNATPDSFSDGGQHDTSEAAVQAGRAMVAAGCRVLDIGGESTRPGSAVITPAQEWERVGPVITALRQAVPQAALSVDTRNGLVMERALAAGAAVINDVTALRHDPGALPLLAGHTCGIVLMHMRGTPQDMEQYAVYEDVACEVVRELGERVDAAEAAGIARSRLMVDPGFGFAKTAAQNVELLRRCLLLANLGCRVVFALSRKRMIGDMTGETAPAARDAGTQAASLQAMPLGQPVLRVHDVPGMMQGVRVWQALYAAKA